MKSYVNLLLSQLHKSNYLGAKPIFIDSELDTWNLCPEILEKAILDRISSIEKT